MLQRLEETGVQHAEAVHKVAEGLRQNQDLATALYNLLNPNLSRAFTVSAEKAGLNRNDYNYFCKEPGHMAKDCPQRSRQGCQGFKCRAPDSGPRNQEGRFQRNQNRGSRPSKSVGYV
mmetsp:Transcript_17118/g.47475  ORF Transcript_17118/g.47475 Transcript_17118/m.47475 type:complete len:118 (-) Transcript_17118:400-753(-)